MRRSVALLLGAVLVLGGCDGGAEDARPTRGATYQPPVHEWPPASTLDLVEPSSPVAPTPTRRADALAYVDYLVATARYSLRSLWVPQVMRTGCQVCRQVEELVGDAVDERMLYRVPQWLLYAGPDVYLLEEIGEARRWGVVTLGTRPLMRTVDEDGRRIGSVDGDQQLWAFEFYSTNGEWHLLAWDAVWEDPFASVA